jgi:hypothetical protein
MAKYISNRQQNLKIGIVSYTENQTVLEVTGKVGIGTTNASAPLEVVGGAVFAGNSPTEIVRITQTGTGPAFIVEDSENPDVTPFVVTTEGQVAIGVGAGGISTGYKLEVDGGDIRFVTGGEGDLIFSHSNLVSNIRAAGSVQLGLGANGGDAIRINLNNNVGLGTTNPTSALYVVGDSYITGILTANRIVSSVYGEFTGGGISGTNIVGTALSISGISTLGVTSTTNLTAQQLSVSGVSTIGNFRITPVGSGATVGGIGITYYGDGSNLTGTILNTIQNIDNNQIYYPVLSPIISGTISSISVSSDSIVFNPGTNSLGIGSTRPTTRLDVIGDAKVSGILTAANILPPTDNTGVVGNTAFTWSNGQFTNLTIDSTLNVRAAIDLADSDILQFGTSDDVKVFYDGTANDLEIELESAANQIAITDNGTYTVVIKKDGSVGIGTTNPTSKLYVVGDGRFTGVVTATTFIGNLTGIATYATNAGISTFSGYASNAGIATYASNAGIATFATTAGIATYATNAGIATYATQLVTPRTFEITGDIVASPISFDGTGNVSLAATIQPNSVSLGSDTTGDYVANITGTANQISVSATSGESSTPTLSIPNQLTAPQDVTVTRDLQVNRNLNVTGNITIGGTSATIFSQSLNIFDPDIILGFRTDGSGNDVSNDNTANHGGVAVASTEGTPLVQLLIAGIETNPATYKKIMWFKAGTFAGLGTDAWLSNYAVGIGSTQFPTGTRLAAGSVQFTENDLAVVRNINASGIITSTGGFIGNLTGTATTATNLSDAANITTGTINSARLTGIYNINISGNAATATYASNAGIATYASNAGIATYATNAGIATATYASNAGIATYASNAGIATYATNAGIATYATNAGISTFSGYASNAGIATYADNAGIATYASNAGIATYASNAGIATYATNAGIATYASNAGIATYATNAGISTFSGYSNVAGIATYASNAGIATYATNAGIATYASNAGIATYATNAGIATYASNAGIATYADNAGIATYASNAGIATYASNAGIATYASNAGISTSVIGGIGSIAQLQVTGISTFTNGPVLIGAATSTGTASQRLQVTGGAYVSSNLGIGTTNPRGSLQVGTAITMYGSTGIISATRYYGDGTNLTGILNNTISPSSASTSQFIGFSSVSSGVNTSIGVSSTFVFIPSSGNLGIGTTNPQGSLQVGTAITMYGSTGIISARRYYGDGTNLTGILNNTISPSSASTSQFIGFSSVSSGVNTSIGVSSTFVFIPSSGNLGIGTTNPTSKLWVNGDGYFVGVLTANRIYSTVYGEFTGGSISGTNIVGTALSITGISTFTNGPVLIGAATSTGTAGQVLQVTGSAYVSDSVGIGTTNPSQSLHVQGNVRITGGLYDSNNNVGTAGSVLSSTGSGISWIAAASGGGIAISTNTTNQNQFLTYATGTGSTTGLGVTTTGLVFNPSSGNLGIGTTNPTSKLYVVGNAYITGVTTSTDFDSLSDINLKTNINQIANPLEKVMQIRGVTFNWKDGNRNSAGVIAQEIEKILPELVHGGETKTVNYNGLIGLLIECVKKQQEEIDELKRKVN